MTLHSKYSSGYGWHYARSRGTLREYGFRCVRLEPREALTDARERSAGLSLFTHDNTHGTWLRQLN